MISINCMPEMQYKRQPAVFRKIIDIKPDDIRVRVIGKVIDKSDNMLIVDDGTGKLDVSFNMPFNSSVSDLVCVFAKVMNLGDHQEFQGELIQNMNDLDISIYRKVMEE